MDARTLEALKASIAKWERNAVAKTPEDYHPYSDTCPLCFLFVENCCNGCPVADSADQSHCEGTPWEDVPDAFDSWRYYAAISSRSAASRAREAALAAAREEVAFLQSLLPVEPTRPDPIIPGDIVGPSVEA